MQSILLISMIILLSLQATAQSANSQCPDLRGQWECYSYFPSFPLTPPPPFTIEQDEKPSEADGLTQRFVEYRRYHYGSDSAWTNGQWYADVNNGSYETRTMCENRTLHTETRRIDTPDETYIVRLTIENGELVYRSFFNKGVFNHTELLREPGQENPDLQTTKCRRVHR